MGGDVFRKKNKDTKFDTNPLLTFSSVIPPSLKSLVILGLVNFTHRVYPVQISHIHVADLNHPLPRELVADVADSPPPTPGSWWPPLAGGVHPNRLVHW